jgi:hypothetical protein
MNSLLVLAAVSASMLEPVDFTPQDYEDACVLEAMQRSEQDFEARGRELGLVGAAPLYGMNATDGQAKAITRSSRAASTRSRSSGKPQSRTSSPR